ncbi:MAG: ligase-associated DNA damage response DEXH box helicase [Rhodospirillaceae bacterium]|jgi:ATP-dependent helicase Lhr and Lhr-like helicase|nr:ligase-associated DNA damage response DEXH box helicase [Rhodospirillaceae bacterium]MBT5190710.1 ligase-associated DNA damage response DEXH box helicase [Rhodospirillaceae bacterium]MBT5898073.1 ligase-associated DNA damage response DEXH box helicase [Rhodospirillaceae bacterium]MBT6430286.1 ligase-associated DNA damage response DEXH box helicase [Rhodospirillaceae bacterium]MBT7755948.1 ligase-associated DNA damage response DEXH box helicase [Rhodospirillaceae bacterium]
MDGIPQKIALPTALAAWFARRGWQPRPHQLAVLERTGAGRSVLLTAPTGGGKTLAGFLPSLCDLIGEREMAFPDGKLHTLYLSPLKALAVDVRRNLEEPISDMDVPIRVESRTGDTPQSRRQRQRKNPPHMLLTTPEQLALLLSYRDAGRYFSHLRYVVIDELHALAANKRGDLLALGLARLAAMAPAARQIGLSATVAAPAQMARFLDPAGPVSVIDGGPGPQPQIAVLAASARVPWAGHMTLHAMADVYNAVKAQQTTLVFVNTRAQAEVVFNHLWRLNEDSLPIALHHGSLAPEQRRKVEAAMVRGALRAVVCTSTLDLGIDWGAVDLVIQVGAPKGLSRLVQRIGRANHRLDEPSHALLVPSNRFEVLECQAAAAAVMEGELDGEGPRRGGLDVLAQHILGTACGGPFVAAALYAEVCRAVPYEGLSRDTFDRVVDYVATGGYALRQYERYARLIVDSEGRHHVTGPRVARQYRLNVGTIVQEPMINVRLLRGRNLGQIEEWFIDQLVVGDTFAFAGEILRFEGMRETSATVSRAPGREAKVPSYYGGKFPLSTYLAARVRDLLADQKAQKKLPGPVRDWLSMQRRRSVLPAPEGLLVEGFPRGGKHYLVCYPFEGRLAHQTLGMLLTRRMERAGHRPFGFVASEYALAVWSLNQVEDVDPLFGEDMLGDDLEEWLAESNLMKRTFRNVALIAGLIDRRHPGQEKTGRQMTFSSDLIYDVLRKYEPDHILLRATQADAATGLLDIGRLGQMLGRIQGRIDYRRLERVSPLAVPLMLEIGKEAVHGDSMEDLLSEAAEDLIEEASRLI